MKRLIDEGLSPDSPEGRLATLIQAMPALERAPFARERVFARVMGAAATRRKRLPWTAVAIAMGLGISAVAAASVGHLEFFVRPSPSSLTTPLTGPLPPAQTTAIPEVIHASATPVPVQDKVDSPAAAQPTRTPMPKLHTRSVEAHPLAAGEDPAPLLEAIRTLRSNHDPVRAGALLADYLKAYPRSPLSEDALALSIEAALARHNTASGAELARRYLVQFPNGRYRLFASHAAQPNLPTDAP